LNAEPQTSDPEVAPAPDAPADEIATLKAALEAAGLASAAARDAQLRSAAELDNVRKRAQRDIENAHRYALERFAGELLGVRDSLELAARNAGTADAQALAAGQQATLQLLAAAFEKFSIQRIDPIGAIFDPSLHEAVAVQESSTARPDSVLQVLQSGYQLNGRLLRPARVIVARLPQAPA
jgi:molecular chaperone GrpE